MNKKTALRLVKDELTRATSDFGPMHSPHEGYAVLKEEVDELWTEVRDGNGRGHRGLSEAVQCAAMSLRYLIDLCDDATADEHDRKVVEHERKAESTPRYEMNWGGYSG